MSDAFKYLKTNLEAQVAAERGTLQTPVLEAGKWRGGELLLAAQPASPRPVPASVIETLESRTVKVESSRPSPQAFSSSSSSSSSSSLDLQDKGASVVPVAVSAAPAAGASGAPKGIPNILGSFMGSNNLKYSYWQSGKNVAGQCLNLVSWETV